MFDDLDNFRAWWMANRPINTSSEMKQSYHGVSYGVVLYRQPPYQVQLFIMPPNSKIDAHIHPNMDSFECFVGGDINFMRSGEWFAQNKLGDIIRITPDSWHGGEFGPSGGCFLSIQKWVNGVYPDSAGNDWKDEKNNTNGDSAVYLSEK